MGQSYMEMIALLPEEERKSILSNLNMEEVMWDWGLWARP